MLLLHPASGIDESFHPRGKLIVSLTWVVGPVPWLQTALNVWHDGEVSAIFGSDACCRKVGSIWISWVAGIAELHGKVVTFFTLW